MWLPGFAANVYLHRRGPARFAAAACFREIMNFLLSVSRGIDRLNTAVGRTVIWLTLLVVLVSATNAIVRKLFNTSSNAWLELQWYLFGAIFLLAAGYTFL